MNISIKYRIYLSFLLLCTFFVINGVFVIATLYKNKQLYNHITEVVDPSLQKLNQFDNLLIESKMFTTNWVFLRSSDVDKQALQDIHTNQYLDLKKELVLLSERWKSASRRDSLQALFQSFESLLQIEKTIMNSLQQFDDYDDPVKKLESEALIENEILPRTAALINSLDVIILQQQAIRAQEYANLEQSSKRVRTVIAVLTIVFIGLGFFFSIYLTRVIIRPINQIKHIIKDLSKGITRKIESRDKNDEIGKMVFAVNNLSEKLMYTASFAQQVGIRNFDAPFQPLSEEDTLGKALVTMRDNLKSVDEKLNEAQHIANLGSWEWDLKNNQIFWSDGLYNVFQQDKSFIPCFKGFMSLIHPEDRKHVMDTVNQCFVDRQPFSYEFRMIGNKGESKIIYAQGNLHANENGELVKMFGIGQDITSRKKTEAVLELKNEELLQKNKELEQFAYVASHDLQEPLRTISSFVERFQVQYNGKLDVTADKYLHYIIQASDRMKVLIKDLLDYSRIGRKKDLVQVDCNVVLEEVLADLEIVITENEALVSADEMPVINGYATEIKLLFQNLIINAIKFRKKDCTPKIRVGVQELEDGWQFCVSDNGIGIDPQHKERIFIIFQRLHTRTEYEGSGIGLSHCKKIVELHGGKIWVESVPGEGSVFYFTIKKIQNDEN